MTLTFTTVECEHCHAQMLELIVTELPMDCPVCGAPLLTLCQWHKSDRERSGWVQFPPFPAKVKV